MSTATALTPSPVIAAGTLPTKVNTAIANACDLLTANLSISSLEASSHRVQVVDGWNQNSETVNAVAVYLVGLLASAISLTLKVRAEIENTAADRLELGRNVEAIVGTTDDSLSTEQKQDERNPWMAEGLWHLCLFLAAERPELHPPGIVIALDNPHVRSKDHGMDVVAIYKKGASFGVSFVECKAYENNPNNAINDAVAFFRDLDMGNYDARIRQVVSRMRGQLGSVAQNEISPSLWKEMRTYIPNPHYSGDHEMNWTNTRPSFRTLHVPAERIIIMPNALSEFTLFFDEVGKAMRTFVATL